MGNVCARIFRKKEVRILIQGLDAAGKTTMLYRLKLGEVVTTIPTIGFNVETIEHKNVSITAWDIGGRDKMKPLVRHYYTNTDAIIFVVDSTDRDRIDEIKIELFHILTVDDLKDACILVLANKQDLHNVMTVEEITEKLELNKIKQRWCLFPTVATAGHGLSESLDWLVNQIATAHAGQVLTDTANNIKTSTDVVTHSSFYGLESIKGIFKSALNWFVPKKP